MTRFYCTADLHGHSDRLRLLETALNHHQPDALILAGDVLGFRSAKRHIAYFSSLDLPVFCVLGNTDPPWADRYLSDGSQMRILKDERIRFRDVELVGISGTIPLPFHSRIGFRETDRVRRLMGQIDDQTMLICHPPPHGVCDKVMGRFSAGSKAVARIVRCCRPAVVICGHIHEAAGSDTLGSTRVVNCAMGQNIHGWVVDATPNQPWPIMPVSIET